MSFPCTEVGGTHLDFISPSALEFGVLANGVLGLASHLGYQLPSELLLLLSNLVPSGPPGCIGVPFGPEGSLPVPKRTLNTAGSNVEPAASTLAS